MLVLCSFACWFTQGSLHFSLRAFLPAMNLCMAVTSLAPYFRMIDVVQRAKCLETKEKRNLLHEMEDSWMLSLCCVTAFPLVCFLRGLFLRELQSIVLCARTVEDKKYPDVFVYQRLSVQCVPSVLPDTFTQDYIVCT